MSTSDIKSVEDYLWYIQHLGEVIDGKLVNYINGDIWKMPHSELEKVILAFGSRDVDTVKKVSRKYGLTEFQQGFLFGIVSYQLYSSAGSTDDINYIQ